MLASLQTRLVTALACVAEEERRSLARSIGTRRVDAVALAEELLRPETLEQTLDRLSAPASELFAALAYGMPYLPLSDGHDHDEDDANFGDGDTAAAEMWNSDPAVQELRARGLVFVSEVAGPFVPIELRMAYCEDEHLHRADTGVLLSRMDDDALSELAAFHQVEALPSDVDDPLAIILRVVERLYDTEHLKELFDQLSPAAQRLLFWATEAPHPIPHRRFREEARALAERSAERSGTVERLLLSIGFVHAVVTSEGEWVVVPDDMRMALDPVVDGWLSASNLAAFETLRGSSLPAFRDLFPRGFQGDPRFAARELMVAAVHGPLDEAHPLVPILLDLKILETGDAWPGEFMSQHLDASGPDLFAQLALRNWLFAHGDRFTDALFRPLGVEIGAVARHLDSREESEEEAQWRLEVAAGWLAFCYQIRAHLLLTLGVLPAGYWFPLRALTEWFLSVYRRVAWRHNVVSLLADAPEPARHGSVVDFDQRTEADLERAIRGLFVNLLAPLGAAQLHPREPLFLVNPEALRCFPEADPEWRELESSARGYLGIDLDLSLPMPVDPTPMVPQSGQWVWSVDGELVASAEAWAADLARVANWATPFSQHGQMRFLFTEDSVLAAIDDDGDASDPLEMLVWLMTQTRGDLPDRVRAVFGAAGAMLSDHPDAAQRAATEIVEGLCERVESWGERPPLELVEDLRGWGDVAVSCLTQRIERAIGEGTTQEPICIHAAIILGEIGADRAAPSVMRLLANADSDHTLAAAGMACARLAPVTCPSLLALLRNEHAPLERRMSAMGALAAAGVLFPTLGDRVFDALTGFANAEELEPEIATSVAIALAETGHPKVDGYLKSLKEMNLWVDSIMPIEECQSLAANAPSVWGHPLYSLPIAQIYPTRTESESMAQERGVDEILRESGLSSDAILGWAQRNASRRRRGDPS